MRSTSNGMKVVLHGRNAFSVQPLVRKAGMTVVRSKPEAVVCVGGDGTFLEAEYHYPGVPKILLRDSIVCKKCSTLPNKAVLERIMRGKYIVEELAKLRVEALGMAMHGVNDIVVHNADARHAIRYRVRVNGVPMGDIIIGDGIVVSTPFGSSGYYRSITDSMFELGIGLAFNNSTEQRDHVVLKEDSVIELTVDRGPVVVYADNQSKAINAGPGDVITIRQCSSRAVLWTPRSGE